MKPRDEVVFHSAPPSLLEVGMAPLISLCSAQRDEVLLEDQPWSPPDTDPSDG